MTARPTCSETRPHACAAVAPTTELERRMETLFDRVTRRLAGEPLPDHPSRTLVIATEGGAIVVGSRVELEPRLLAAGLVGLLAAIDEAQAPIHMCPVVLICGRAATAAFICAHPASRGGAA